MAVLPDKYGDEMEFYQEPCFDVRERLDDLGCVQPSTVSILPLNLETASSPLDFVFPTSTATVHTLLRNTGISYDEILPQEISKRYKLDRADDLILPPLFLAACWLYNNRAALEKVLDVLKDYLQRRFTASGPSQVSFEVVRENPDGSFTKVSYNGPLEGLAGVLDTIDSQSPPRQLPRNE